jgi:hypothetical protein
MRLGLSQDQQQVPRSAPDVMPPPTAAPTTKEIPYDYVAIFKLTGERGKRLQDVINISIEGAFVAVTIGYSVSTPENRARGFDSSTTEFKYSIVDSGSGRELQNKSIHNIAGLGEPTGRRPFRPLAKPMLFMPRSTIRIEVEEITVGTTAGAELFIVLHGYKILGYGTGLP